MMTAIQEYKEHERKIEENMDNFTIILGAFAKVLARECRQQGISSWDYVNYCLPLGIKLLFGKRRVNGALFSDQMIARLVVRRYKETHKK